MALESDHCENSEINCTIEDFLILKATISFYEQTPVEVVNRSCCTHEVPKWMWLWLHVQRWTKRRKIITEHNSKSWRCNISSLCDISV